MNEYCRVFGCQEKPTVVIGSWHYCNKHAKQVRQELAHQHNRSKAIDNITRGLTLEELQSLSADKVRASNDLYEALITINNLANGYANNMPEIAKLSKQALSRADGGK